MDHHRNRREATTREIKEVEVAAVAAAAPTLTLIHTTVGLHQVRLDQVLRVLVGNSLAVKVAFCILTG